MSFYREKKLKSQKCRLRRSNTGISRYNFFNLRPSGREKIGFENLHSSKTLKKQCIIHTK